jgi:two-component system, chemotaxis family, chemotaxis protein CheY
MRALVIDDSRAMRFILKQILVELGFEVQEAVDGRQGLELLKELGKADVVLVDWNMPEMNGLQFVRAVRGERAYEDTPLMMVTTEIEMVNVTSALEAGANEYIMKPFTREMIKEKLTMLGIVQA